MDKKVDTHRPPGGLNPSGGFQPGLPQEESSENKKPSGADGDPSNEHSSLFEALGLGTHATDQSESGQWVETLSKNVEVIKKDEAYSEKKEAKADAEQRTHDNETPRIQNSSLLEGYENEVRQALKMSGGAPVVTIRTADGKIIGQVSVSDLHAWGFGPSEKPVMEQWGEVPPPDPGPFSEQKEAWPTKLQSLRPSLPSFPSTSKTQPRGVYKLDKAFPSDGRVAGGWSRFSTGSSLYGNLFGAQITDDLYASRREIRKTEHELKAKMRIILFLILMGDVQGALRVLSLQAERENKMFNRLLLQQLYRVREAKSKILLAMGRHPPPRVHVNAPNSQGEADDKNAQARYTQWVSVTTQLMSEVQQTERELLDVLQESRRNIQDLWETYGGIKEAEARTTRTVIQSFRG